MISSFFMKSLFVFLLIGVALNEISNLHLCDAVKLKHAERKGMSNLDSRASISNGDFNAPPICAGDFQILNNIEMTTASFGLNCNTNECNVTRNSYVLNTQRVFYLLPEQISYNSTLGVYANYDKIIDDPTCQSKHFQPEIIIINIQGLVYNYAINILDAVNYTVTRTFDHLDSAELYIDDELVASISANSSSISQSQTITCSAQDDLCAFKPIANPNSSYIGNDYLRFYYDVPTFIIPFANINNTITDVCTDYQYYPGSEEILCAGGENPIGPCLANDISSSILFLAAQGFTSPSGPIICKYPPPKPKPHH